MSATMLTNGSRCPACHTTHLPGAPCHVWPNTIAHYPAPAGSDTLGEAEARRAGYAAGYDEASKRSGARIAELEAEVAETERLRAAAVAYQSDLIHKVAGLRRDEATAYARGFAAAREAAAKVCEAFPAKTHGALATAPYAAAEQAADECAEAIRALRPEENGA